MTQTRTDLVDIIVDCHAYAWHEEDEYYPECGPNNLVRMAEMFAVLVSVVEDDDPRNPAPGWAWWYRIQGPRDNVVRLLADEYSGSIEEAEEMVDGNVGAYVPIGFKFQGAAYERTNG